MSQEFISEKAIEIFYERNQAAHNTTLVIDLLLSGKKVSEIAEIVGVTSQRVYQVKQQYID